MRRVKACEKPPLGSGQLSLALESTLEGFFFKNLFFCGKKGDWGFFSWLAKRGKGALLSSLPKRLVSQAG